ncbi:bile acid:sodium symporter family protein [Sphingomonas sp. ID0503]|uniref:bile acid:sodium symporter family protein n=1 Tax=Sphingomonas sp. ID0503 TaxID=3399691 RepID=UPI003AFB193E
MDKLKAALDPFVVILLATVMVASLLPARGPFAGYAGIAADLGIALLFFLNGAKLSRAAIVTGLRNIRLHAAVLASTYILFPCLGLAVLAIGHLDPMLARGLLFLTLLPSTVQSSVAFTAIARGNVAAAICSASISNLLGIALTPLFVTLTMGAAASMSWESVQGIFLQLLLPFAVGHLLRPLIGGWVEKRRRLLSRVDRGSILLVVYTAFGHAVIEGLWSRVSLPTLGLVTLACALILAVVLAATWGAARALSLPREDAIVLLFCGSKKSLASGVPMANVLFPASAIGMIILPLMIFHQLQLIVCAMIAPRLGQRGERESDTSLSAPPVAAK